MAGRKRTNRQGKGNAIAEFGPALWIFFLLFIIPVVDLASFMWGVGTVMLVANMSARQAAGARTFSEAINLVNKTEDEMASFRNFALIVPSAGAARGVKLQVIANPIAGGNTAPTVYAPPPAPNRIPVDRGTLENTLYHYQVIASYDVQPLMNFNGLPIFNDVPGLGKPVPVSFDSTVSVERPEGLND